MRFRIDDEIKMWKENRLTNSSYSGQAFMNCEYCGNKFYTGLPTLPDIEHAESSNNGDMLHPFCSDCLTKIVQALIKPKVLRIEIITCRYCGKKRKLVGTWCRTCRNNFQRKEIKRILSGKTRSFDDKEILRFYENFPIWRKEFKKVKI